MHRCTVRDEETRSVGSYLKQEDKEEMGGVGGRAVGVGSLSGEEDVQYGILAPEF